MLLSEVAGTVAVGVVLRSTGKQEDRARLTINLRAIPAVVPTMLYGRIGISLPLL